MTKGIVAVVAAGAVLIALVLLVRSFLFGASLPLRIVADVPLPGDTSRLDYASLDPETGVLFIAHLGAGNVIAFDTTARRVIGTVDGTASVRGVLAVPELHRVYAAAQGTQEIVVIDEPSLRIVARVRAGDVDGLAYDPNTQQLFVSDESGSKDTVIDVRRNQVVARIELGGEAGNTQFDPVSRHVFVAVQTRNQLAEIDPRTHRVVERYDLPGCLRGHGVAVDAAGRAVYVACQINAALVKFDLRAHRVVAKAGIGIAPDVLAIDPVLGRLYVASESGIVSVFDISPNRFVKLGQQWLAANAHVVAVDAARHRVYFPLRDIGGRPVLRIAVPEGFGARLLHDG